MDISDLQARVIVAALQNFARVQEEEIRLWTEPSSPRVQSKAPTPASTVPSQKASNQK
jgi:hypothetical protein